MSDSPAAAAPASPAANPTSPSSTPAPASGEAPKKAGVGDQVATPPKTESKAPEAKAEAERRKYHLKTDGAEEDWEGTDDDIVRELQLSKTARKRIQESTELKKQMATVIEYIKQNPWEALKDPVFGVDLEQLAEQRLADKYRETIMSPEEKAASEQKKREDAIAAERDKYRTELEKRQQAEVNARVFQETERTFNEALANEGIERSYETMYEMARVAKLNLEHGIELTPAQLASEVRSAIEGRRGALEKRVLGGLKGEKLLAHLGDAVVKEIIRAQLAKIRPATGQSGTPPPQKTLESEKTDEPRRTMSPTEFRRRNMFGLDK